MKTGLTTKQEEAAVMVAEDHYDLQQIAEKIGITPRALYKWRQKPAFQERVERLSEQIAKDALKRGVARKGYRINVLADLQRKLLSVIEQRASDPTMVIMADATDEKPAEAMPVPGADTGLIVRKSVVSAGALVGYEYEVDTATVRELRAVQEQVAKELGQLVEKTENKTDLTVKESKLSDAELDQQIIEISAKLAIAPGQGTASAAPAGKRKKK